MELDFHTYGAVLAYRHCSSAVRYTLIERMDSKVYYHLTWLELFQGLNLGNEVN